ncbi:tetratricopeptide repeat protein [Streptomyces sp. NPDC059142]|uniref:tetratricopeptide repeat protein n=1 Tax=Streptomyces sp. NPDC059142 TaxID=3346739 RepID=UPI0036B016D9
MTGDGGGRWGNSVNGGTQHGPVVQAREIGSYTSQHFHFHGGEESGGPLPGTAPTGHQLPLGEVAFKNRVAESGDVLRALDREVPSGPVHPLIVTLSGISGIGKTALAVHLAHELKSRFPWSTYVDLDEWRTAGAVDTEAVLKHLLRRLGVREGWLPAGYRDLVGMYKTVTDGARMVLVLDNVWSADEVTTLLPVSARSVVLVAGQRRLHALEGPRTVALVLEPLRREPALDVLSEYIGSTGRQVSPQMVSRLEQLCAGFPIALHTAGGLLREHPSRRVERIVADLTAALHEKGLSVVEAVWNAAYDALDAADAQRLYHLMPRYSGYDLTLEAAMALLGTGRDDAEDALDLLTNAGLLADSPRPGRKRLHDLLRAHAVRRADRYGDPAETEDGLRRLVAWYRRQAERADRVIAPERMRVAEPVPALPYAPDVPFAGEAEARSWLDTERKALYGLVGTASDLGEDTHAWSLCEPLWKHYEDHHNHTDAIRAFGTGRDAARREGSAEATKALIRMRCQLAQALWKAGRPEEADTETRQALRSAESVVPDTKLHASALEFRGKFLAACGRPDDAVPYFERSRALHAALPNPYGVLLQSLLLGRTLRAAGRSAEAGEELETALALAREEDHPRMIGRTAAELGRTYRDAGRPERAFAAYEEALDQERRRESTYDQAVLHEELAALAEEAGDRERAEEHRGSARELRVRAGAEPGRAGEPGTGT